jgi:hypothetical protein
MLDPTGKLSCSIDLILAELGKQWDSISGQAIGQTSGILHLHRLNYMATLNPNQQCKFKNELTNWISFGSACGLDVLTSVDELFIKLLLQYVLPLNLKSNCSASDSSLLHFAFLVALVSTISHNEDMHFMPYGALNEERP